MCTVTLLPIKEEKNGFILTSNRDEAVERKTRAPEEHFFKNKKMLFPMDEEGGGTWIGASENKRVVCLLNGAFEPHKREETYRMSRGVAVKEFLDAEDIKKFISEYNFTGIEPFTSILIDYAEKCLFFELVWNGKKKFFKQLELKSHIWSSAPLYSEAMKKERAQWFFDFEKTKTITAQNLWDFHHTAGTGDKNKDLVIDRGFLKTRSITQVVKTSKKIKMKYKDLDNGELVEKIF